MEQIINKAIEGGYIFEDINFPKGNPFYTKNSKNTIEEGKIVSRFSKDGWDSASFIKIEYIDWNKAVLSSLFWQALGKACGWGATNRLSPRENVVIRGQEDVNYALIFHETNLVQGWDQAIAYLSDLTTS